MLTKRLLAVSQFVSRDTSLADIGSDHALLPIYLLQQNLAQRASSVNWGTGLTSVCAPRLPRVTAAV